MPAAADETLAGEAFTGVRFTMPALTGLVALGVVCSFTMLTASQLELWSIGMIGRERIRREESEEMFDGLREEKKDEERRELFALYSGWSCVSLGVKLP